MVFLTIDLLVGELKSRWVAINYRGIWKYFLVILAAARLAAWKAIISFAHSFLSQKHNNDDWEQISIYDCFLKLGQAEGQTWVASLSNHTLLIRFLLDFVLYIQQQVQLMFLTREKKNKRRDEEETNYSLLSQWNISALFLQSCTMFRFNESLKFQCNYDW